MEGLRGLWVRKDKDFRETLQAVHEDIPALAIRTLEDLRTKHLECGSTTCGRRDATRTEGGRQKAEGTSSPMGEGWK